MIWIIIGILVLVVFLLVAQPLYSKANNSAAHDNEIAEYAVQVDELNQRIGAADSSENITALELAKTDLQRQVIKKTEASAKTAPPAMLVSSLLVFFAFGALGLYATLGSPELTQSGARQKSGQPQQLTSIQDTKPANGNNLSLEQAIASLESRLKNNDANNGQADTQGWMLYARSLMSLRRFDEALLAYERVMLLTDDNANVRKEFESAKTYIAAHNDPIIIQPNAPGPSAEQIRDAASMAPADRQDMIKSMVDRLAGKLANNPDDPDGWVRLLKARKVLGQTAQAESDIARVKKIFGAEPEKITKILKASGWTE